MRRLADETFMQLLYSFTMHYNDFHCEPLINVFYDYAINYSICDCQFLAEIICYLVHKKLQVCIVCFQASTELCISTLAIRSYMYSFI